MRYRLERIRKTYEYVSSIEEALAFLVENYPGCKGFVNKYQMALEAGRSPIVMVDGVQALKIVPCKDLAPCPKCGREMIGLGDECLDCEANYN